MIAAFWNQTQFVDCDDYTPVLRDFTTRGAQIKEAKGQREHILLMMAVEEKASLITICYVKGEDFVISELCIHTELHKLNLP